VIFNSVYLPSNQSILEGQIIIWCGGGGKSTRVLPPRGTSQCNRPPTDHSSWAVTLGSLTCEEGGNLSTRDFGFLYVSSEGRDGCEFIHLAQPTDAPSSSWWVVRRRPVALAKFSVPTHHLSLFRVPWHLGTENLASATGLLRTTHHELLHWVL
jgi:hypothetical protein